MAVTFDNASTATAAAATSLQWTHTAGGSNAYMIMAIGTNIIGGGSSISSAAYNGVALSQVAFINGPTAAGRFGAWQLQGPNIGAFTASCTLATNARIVAAACTYNGVSQAGANGGVATATALLALNPVISISSTVGNMIFAVAYEQASATFATMAGATQRFNFPGGTAVVFGGCDKAATNGSNTISWSTGTATPFATFAINISATGAAVASTLNMLALLGVGS